MNKELINEIQGVNPWLEKKELLAEISSPHYVERQQFSFLMNSEWDELWLILVGPRQAGKTTLGKHICQQLVQQGRFPQLLYLNCDLLRIREWISGIVFLKEAREYFHLTNFILFIDEVQRLESPGLILKAIHDLKLPCKLIASGSSQLEIKSKVQEYLTGRHLEAVVLPFSEQELSHYYLEDQLLYGCYPQIVQAKNKTLLLQQLYNTYINKDIIEILKISKSDVMQKLLGLIAHSCGQLVNYQQLAVDCKVSAPTVQHYLSILEKTYVVQSIQPFVGNKRQELTSNLIYYFIDNGFRNKSLDNFSPLQQRSDLGLLVQNYIFQFLIKYQTQYFKSFKIYYWRTKGGAEVDFVIYKNDTNIVPIEVKHRSFTTPKITRGFRSFLESYQPKYGLIITKDYYDKKEVEGCLIEWVPLSDLKRCLLLFEKIL